MKQLDGQVVSALEEVGPNAADRFKINLGREGFRPLSPYSFAGNSVSQAKGGILVGSSMIHRDVKIGDSVNVTVMCRSDWRFFAGEPYITLLDRKASDNDWFIDALTEALADREILIQID